MSRTPSAKIQPKEELSEEMIALLKSRNQVKDWSSQVEKRLYEMEDAYLKETPFGNVIRGFEVEGGTRSRGERGREINDEKERLFSASSWKVYEERSLTKATPALSRQVSVISTGSNSEPALKTRRK
jgi:hypothetical protein